MLKTNYDDLSSMSEGGQKSRKKLSKAVVAVICLLTLIIIAVAVLIIYNLLSKVEAPTAGTTVAQTSSFDVPSEAPAEAVPEASGSTEATVLSPNIPETALEFNQGTTAASLKDTSRKSFDAEVKYQNYTLVGSETLETVASKFNVSIQTLLSINQIKNPAAVVAGTSIMIPDRNGRYYTVEKDDTLSYIVNKFNLTIGWKTLMEINGLKGEGIFVGQKLFIPDESSVESISFAASGIDFSSPLSKGHVVAYYGQSQVNPGTKASKLLDGILISGSEGASINAASFGTVMDVAYDASKEMGFFVKISHEGGYNSYYCFLNSDSVSVSVSDKVDAGQKIGTISSESSPYDSPTLLFKIEQNGIMLDPSVFF